MAMVVCVAGEIRTEFLFDAQRHASFNAEKSSECYFDSFWYSSVLAKKTTLDSEKYPKLSDKKLCHNMELTLIT